MPCALIAGAFLALASPSLAAEVEVVTPVADILREKKKYDRRWLCVMGKSSALDTQVSPVRHHKYWTAILEDDASRIVLFAYGDPPFKNGEVIEACGIFARLKKAQSTGEVFHDEFNVTNILRGAAMRTGRVKITPTGIATVAQDGKTDAPKYADPAQPLNAVGGAPASR